jgi:hypothetical protein
MATTDPYRGAAVCVSPPCFAMHAHASAYAVVVAPHKEPAPQIVSTRPRVSRPTSIWMRPRGGRSFSRRGQGLFRANAQSIE